MDSSNGNADSTDEVEHAILSQFDDAGSEPLTPEQIRDRIQASISNRLRTEDVRDALKRLRERGLAERTGDRGDEWRRTEQ